MRSGVRITGIVLLGVIVVGLAVRLLGGKRFGRSGSDTIPLQRPSGAGSTGLRSGATALLRQVSGQHASGQRDTGRGGGQPDSAIVAQEEETEVAIKEPGITASPNRALAMTAGTLFAIWGFLGFFFAQDNGGQFFSREGGFLWNSFMLNPALCAIWALLAAAFFIVGLGNTVGSRAVNLVIGVVLLVLAVYGFVFSATSANVLALNTTDNVFHAIVGVVLVLTALGADKENLRALRAARA
ncbi:hypothetical protein DEJ32_15815 [Curtobacterium sp. MCPF17_046]|nr:hypothetical protein DEJ32_15815 [Curtobacterium sp. MCPF17_046]